MPISAVTMLGWEVSELFCVYPSQEKKLGLFCFPLVKHEWADANKHQLIEIILIQCFGQNNADKWETQPGRSFFSEISVIKEDSVEEYIQIETRAVTMLFDCSHKVILFSRFKGTLHPPDNPNLAEKGYFFIFKKNIVLGFLW